MDCTGCIHKKICELWENAEGQDASCYDENCKETLADILGDDYDPDRLRELVEADRDGRCAILPLKELFQRLGDDVFIIQDGIIFEAFLGFVGYTTDGDECIDTVYDLGCEDEERFLFKFSDVGKTVFPTREAAEDALKGEPDGET